MAKDPGMRRIAPVLLIAAAVVAPASADATPTRICGHAALTGAEPITRHPDRLGQFYFNHVNSELGGIDGHPVTMRIVDDRFYPAGARAAVEECRRLGTDLYVGLFGGDPARSAARWAENNKVPYLHTSVVAGAELPDAEWSALITPTEAAMLTGLANSLVASVRDPVFGMVRYDVASSEQARDAFAGALAQHERTLEADVVVQKDENEFVRAWAELEHARVTHVVLHVAAPIAQRMLAQKPPTIEARFASIFDGVATNRTSSTLSDVAFLAFNDPSPVYDPDDPALPWRADIEEFHRIFATYGPEPSEVPDDLDWISYLRAKQLHRFLDALEGNVAAGSIRSAFGSYQEQPGDAFPACALDFTAVPNVGGRAWHVFRLANGSWEQAGTCLGTAGADLDPPTIECGGLAGAALAPMRCSVTDAGSGVASTVVIDRPVLGPPEASETIVAGCPETVSFDVDLAPGLHTIDVQATDCDGQPASRRAIVISA